MKAWAIVLVVALLFATVALGGCSVIAKKAVEGATGVKVDENGDSVTVKGTDGSESTISSGEGKLAEDFPDSVPVYDGDIVDSTVIHTGDVSQWTASISTGDAVDDVKSFYAERLAAEGWKITLDMDAGTGADRTVAYTAELDDLALTVTIAAPDSKTEIAILVGTKSK